MKKIRYFFEALLLHILYLIFSALPAQTASNLGGWLGRTIGPRLAASRKALKNIEMALPGLSAEQHRKAITDMWDNLGRVMAEYPHLEYIAGECTEVEGTEFLDDLFSHDHGAIFFGAHMSNWEVNCAATLLKFGKECDITYRAPNNPWSDRLLMQARSLNGRLRTYSKSRTGGKELMNALKEQRYVGMLIDQKYNEGISVPFFGQPAMTNPVFVQLCQKYKCALIPVRNERLGPASFKLTVYAPLTLFDEQGEPLPVEDVIESAHEHLESWISERPGEWLWLHRRWSDVGKAA